MNKVIAILAACLLSTAAMAETVDIQTNQFGSGVPGSVTTEVQPVGELRGLWHGPQYLPGVPTAATIYPRVVDVKCKLAKNGNALCEGYNWLPEMGRGEYLFIRPVIEAPPPVAPPVPKKRIKE